MEIVKDVMFTLIRSTQTSSSASNTFVDSFQANSRSPLKRSWTSRHMSFKVFYLFLTLFFVIPTHPNWRRAVTMLL